MTPMRSVTRHNALFAKLLLYFLAVMLVPVLLTSLYLNSIASRNTAEALVRMSESSLSGIGDKTRECIESYRHIVYQLSSDPVVVTVLAADGGTAGQAGVYEKMFSIIKGHIENAAAHIVSSSGKTQFSTHQFPSLYDIRYQTASGSPLSYWQLNKDSTASIVRTDRYINNASAAVALNLVRKVTGESGRVVGYAVIDVFHSTLAQLCAKADFADIVLINADNLTAGSLLKSDRYGDFTIFPELKLIHPPYQGTYTGLSAIVSVFPVYESQLFIAGILRTDTYLSTLRETSLVILWIILAGIAISIVLAAIFSTSIARPIDTLASSMRRLESGDFTVQVPERRRDKIGQLNRSFNIMVKRIESLVQRTKEEEKLLAAAELKALQSQINPHFLYNTLGAIKSIAKLHGEEEIHAIVVQLGRLLRGAIEASDEVIPLQKTIEQAESYLIIQQIRFGDKLTVNIDVPEEILALKTPKLLLQPIVENAVAHGLEKKIGEWRISITGKRDNGFIRLGVADNGIGFDASAADFRTGGKKVGMANVYRRLKLYYGERADLLVESRIGEGSSVTLIIPADRAEGP
jgi:two-component system, sensor histidine kinase YesM